MRRFTTSGGITDGRGSGTQAPFWALTRLTNKKVRTATKSILNGIIQGQREQCIHFDWGRVFFCIPGRRVIPRSKIKITVIIRGIQTPQPSLDAGVCTKGARLGMDHLRTKALIVVRLTPTIKCTIIT